MRASATRKAVLSMVLGAIACVGSPELRADPLDPDAFASLGVFDPTTPGTYRIDYNNNAPTLVDPNGKTVATGVESNGIAVFDFDSISLTTTDAAGIGIDGTQAGLTAFLSRGDISVTNADFIFNGVGFSGPYGPGAGGNGNPFIGTGPLDHGLTLYTGGGGGGFGTAGYSAVSGYVPGGAGGMAYGDLSKALQAGSGGGNGDPGKPGGAGGGAIELGALGTIRLVGSYISANGADGFISYSPSGNGGGGSGGGIFIHAPTVRIDNGALYVHGGMGAGFGGEGRILIETNNPLGDTAGYPIKPLAVPEPGSGLLVGLGLASLVAARRLRKRGG